jgi:filamentous hemagglutinin family protein
VIRKSSVGGTLEQEYSMKNTAGLASPVCMLVVVMVVVLPLLGAPLSQGQTTSITSSGLNTQVSHVAGQPNYDITGGTRPGNGTNLFHSFGDLSVGTNHVARFLNDSGRPTTNILSRVTGGNPSNIFGEINTTNFPGGNLYLINPAGVLFGPTATLNVSGAAYISTADFLRLADGLRFNTVPGPQDALLSQAPVVAFGFLNAHPRPITVQGSQLTVAEGKGLSLVGGDIRMTRGTLTAPGGQINLVSLAGRGEARIAPDGIATAGRTARGHIEITGGTQPEDVARLDTSGDRGGVVVIRGGKLSLTRAEITTDARAEIHRGGDIEIEAGDVTLQNSHVNSGSYGSLGDSGHITVKAAQLRLMESSFVSETSGGHALTGNIVINVGRLIMRGGSISTSGIEPSADGGDITVSARDAITMDRSGIGTGNWAGAKSGSITVSTPDLTLNRAGIGTHTLEAPAGDISVNVRTLNIVNGGRISSGISGGGLLGSSGNIHIVASRSISMTGVGVDSRGRDVPSGISTENGGGRTGSIHLVAPTMRLADGAFVSAGGYGLTGNTSIVMNVGRLDILRGARISSFGGDIFGGEGEGGIPIEINAAKSITLDHGTITANTSWVEQGGKVHLQAGKSIELRNGSLISAEPTDVGDAGHIAIQAGRSVIIRDSTISAKAERGNGGTIDVDAKQVTLTNSQLTTSVAGGPETVGGDISVEAKTLILRNSQLLSTATEGQGGAITIRSRALRRDAKSVIDASSETGTDGTVTIDLRR